VARAITFGDVADDEMIATEQHRLTAAEVVAQLISAWSPKRAAVRAIR